MSAADAGTGREPGAVPVEGHPSDQNRPTVDLAGQPTRAEAEARAEEIKAEVARTDARRAEEEAAKADEAVEEAESRRRAAHEAQEQARAHAQEVSSDAQDGARGVSGASSYRAVAVSTPASGGGQPIVFGPFTAERPELLVAAAFVGGFLLAKIIRGIAS